MPLSSSWLRERVPWILTPDQPDFGRSDEGPKGEYRFVAV